MSGTTSGVSFSANGEDTDMLLFRGKSLSFEVVWGGTSPIDITGNSATLQVRDYQDRLQLELSTANGSIQNGGPTGRFSVSAAPAATRAVSAPGRYELEMSTPSGQVYRIISGAVAIADEIVQ